MLCFCVRSLGFLFCFVSCIDFSLTWASWCERPVLSDRVFFVLFAKSSVQPKNVVGVDENDAAKWIPPVTLSRFWPVTQELRGSQLFPTEPTTNTARKLEAKAKREKTIYTFLQKSNTHQSQTTGSHTHTNTRTRCRNDVPDDNDCCTSSGNPRMPSCRCVVGTLSPAILRL